MAKVHLLEDALINKIAAGEVVERPASVLKELVENALDAGATQIHIELEEGGRRRLMVQDNGGGMTPEDARLAMRRHSTSKISQVHDLFQVGTLGFRGEALASISSVCRFTLQTRAEDDDHGLRLEMVDGKTSESVWNGEVGTRVTVADLFYNLPARQAFMRTSATEYAHCLEYLQSLALARPDCEFVLIHNSKESFRAPRQSSDQPRFWGEKILRRRFQDVFPKERTDAFLYLESRDKFGSFEALISPPGEEKGQAKGIHTFVNGRWVKDKTLRYGVMRGYHSHLLKGKYPICALYCTIDPTLVDVNVHPAKAEVRFQYGKELQSLIALNIRDRLRQGAWAQPPGVPAPEASSQTRAEKDRQLSEQPVASPRKPADLPFDIDLQFSPEPPPTSGTTRSRPGSSSAPMTTSRPVSAAMKRSGRDRPQVTQTRMSFDGGAPASAEPLDKPQPSASEPASQETYQIPWDELTFIGTFNRCYLFFETHDYLLAIDQHAFHERILFEKLTRDRSLLEQVQPLLVPETIDLPAELCQKLEDQAGVYGDCGFQYQVISPTEIELQALPTILKDRDPEALFQEMLEQPHDPKTVTTSQLAHQLLSTMACHAAVRSGETLDDDDLRQLIAEARDVDFYHNCPHGRRVFKWWHRNQVAAWFDR